MDPLNLLAQVAGMQQNLPPPHVPAPAPVHNPFVVLIQAANHIAAQVIPQTDQRRRSEQRGPHYRTRSFPHNPRF